jgi:hypothetical protein
MTPLTSLMRAKAIQLDASAGGVGRRGHYRQAYELIRLAQLLREAAAQLEAWEQGAPPPETAP